MRGATRQSTPESSPPRRSRSHSIHSQGGARSARLARKLRGAFDPSVLQLLDIMVLGAQLAEDAAVTHQVSGADRDEIGFRGLQKLLDLPRHPVVALVEHLVEDRLEPRIFVRIANGG